MQNNILEKFKYVFKNQFKTLLSVCVFLCVQYILFFVGKYIRIEKYHPHYKL